MKLKRHERGWQTEDGRYLIEWDYFLTGCECPWDLCKHDNNEREEWMYFVYDSTKKNRPIEEQGLPDAVFSAFTLREVREWLKV